MTYTKFHADWKDKPSKETPVTSQALEHIENGVAAAHVTADAAIPKSVVDAKGDLVVASGADALTRLPVGGDAQYLTADSGTATGLRWRALTGTINASVVDAKGDLLVATANDTVARLAVGSNNQVLIADSAQTTGTKWGAVTDAVANGSITDAMLAGSISPSKVTGTAVVNADSRLTDSRTPTSHATSHKSGGSDAIKLDELAAPTSAVDVNSQKITSLATPTNSADAVTKAYADGMIPKSLGTAKGDIIAFTASGTPARLAAASNGYLLSYDSGTSTGLSATTVPLLRNGAGIPSNGTGVDGDFYIDTSNSRLYGPKAAGAWSGTYVPLTGSDGADGVSFVFRGPWASGTSYVAGDWVSYGACLWACNGSVVSNSVAPPSDAGWELATNPLSPPYLGATQQMFVKGHTATTVTASTIGVGASRVAPIFIPIGATIDKLTIEVTAAEASSVGRLGIYGCNSNGNYPGTLLQHGTFDGSGSAGMRVVDITNVTSTGLFWLAYKPETSAGGTLAVRGFQDGPVEPWVVNDSAVSATDTMANGYVCSSGENSTTLRSTFPTWNGTGFGYTTKIPRVGVILA